MLFVSISFALGSQHKRDSQWNMGLRIDTGAWDVIGAVVCISRSAPHSVISNAPNERSIFLLLNYIKHVNID